MNSMFMKILLWFGITVALMFVGVMVITTIQFQSAPPRSAFQPFFAELAVEVLEQKGKPGLEEFLKQYTRSTGSTSVLLDSTGRDVLTGGYHEFPKPTRPVMFPMFERPIYAPRVAVYKNYTLITYPKKEETFAWWVIPQNLWILGVGILLCFLLAAYLSYPVRNIQRVVEQYGEGNLDLRLRSKRGDEFGKLAGTFDRMADRIQTLLSAEKRLLLDISHELRSPLARMSVALELLDEPGERDAAKAQLRRETERLNELIGGLIEVTWAEGEPAEIRRDLMPVCDLITAISRDCAYEAREREVEIIVSCEAPLEVKGDSELLRRAIENVLRNALRYAPVHSKVHLNCAKEHGQAVLRIRDFGPGVPEAALERLFDPFFRAEDDRNRRQGGSGLGLSIARRAIAVHGGSIAASNANPGLCVEIRIGLANAEAHA